VLALSKSLMRFFVRGAEHDAFMNLLKVVFIRDEFMNRNKRLKHAINCQTKQRDGEMRLPTSGLCSSASHAQARGALTSCVQGRSQLSASTSSKQFAACPLAI
jgi:hypothetical protein